MWVLRTPGMAPSGLVAQAFSRKGLLSSISLRSINLKTKLNSFRTFSLVAPFTSSALDTCHSPQAVKGEVDVFLKGVGNKDTIEDVKRILEMANRALLRREVLHSDFLTPPVLKESMLALDKISDIKIVAQGGYPEAERCRLSVGHPDVLTSDPYIVAALSISGNFGFETCTHGDFLGTILGTGIVRDKLGDIILQGEKRAHVLVVLELVDFLVSTLYKTVEASLRLDAIASSGFKISRSKMASLISDGDVRVNWATVTKIIQP